MRKPWITAMALALPLTLAACGGSAPPGTQGSGGGGGSGGSGDTITIGSLHPLSGAAAADGQQMDNGAKLAVDAINKDGGIKALDGAKLELASADTKGAPEVGQSEAQRLIEEGAVALVGTYQSAVSQNVAAVAERNQVPFVIDVSSADQILQQGYKYTFRLQPSAKVLAERGAQYLSDVSKDAGSPAKKVAILHEQGPFGTAIKDTFTAKAQSLGMDVGPVISYDPASVSDFTTQITSIREAGADVLMVAGYYRDGVLVANAVNTVKPDLDAVWGVANGAFDTPQFPGEVGAAGEGYFDANYRLDITNPDTKKLVDLYKQTYNDDMRTAAVLSYDAVRVIAAALEKSGDASPKAVRDAIAKTKMDSLIAQDGPITFSESGENENAAPILMQVVGGTVKQVFPEKYAETKPVYPASPGK
jgi:branched-chain amino acid transport system substrate-binding protein